MSPNSPQPQGPQLPDSSVASDVSFLDSVTEGIKRQVAIPDHLDRLFKELASKRQRLDTTDWEVFIATRCANHEIASLLKCAPLVRHACAKPRGYAGDAPLIDFLYRVRSPITHEALEKATDLGRLLHQLLTQASSAAAVRQRREFIAQEIDNVARSVRGPSILSVACGHLREAERSQAVAQGLIQRFVALDQDALSLETLRESHAYPGLQPLCMSIKRLLVRPESLEGNFDLIYSLGLFDYLVQPLAQRLVAGLFARLRPGGRLIVANFLKGIPDAGFMEAFLQWKLLFRSRHEIQDLTATLPSKEIAASRYHEDSLGQIGYLEIVRS